MSRTDSSGQDGLWEAVEALRVKWARWPADKTAPDSHNPTVLRLHAAHANELRALLAEHPATPTEETADLTGPEQMAARALAEETAEDEDREALADWCHRWTCSYLTRKCGCAPDHLDYGMADRLLASDWFRDLMRKRLTKAEVADLHIAYEAMFRQFEAMRTDRDEWGRIAERRLQAEVSAKAEAERLRIWCEQHERRRAEVERVLDDALGPEESNWAGEGLVADVALLAQRAKAADRRADDNEAHYLTAKAEVDDLRARLAKVEALADELHDDDVEHRIRAALANPDAAGEGAEACVEAPLAASGLPDDQRRHPRGQQDASEENR